MKNPRYSSAAILQLFKKHGQMAYGEQVTQISHAIQAGLIARDWGFDDELILAAFLHDIGHLVPLDLEGIAFHTMGNYGVEAHDQWGKGFLQEQGFSERLVATVSNHVAAKRYLCFADPVYYASLSEASRQTLIYQGGAMQADEAAAFNADPFFVESIELRRADEAAKTPGFVVTEAHWHYFAALLDQAR